MNDTVMEKPVETTSPALNDAICLVMLDVKRLRKADNNAFAKYRYTSVDDFKDDLRPKLAEHGLSVHADEVGCETFEHTNSKKETSLHAKFRFNMWLEHSSGEREKPEGLTVILPYTGAQTTGAARSYAVKEWLKSKFLASSGDSEDADQGDGEVLSKSEARKLYEELQAELKVATAAGEDAMKEWGVRRKPSIIVLPNDWQLHLRRQYEEGRATGTVREIAEEFDPLQYFDDLEIAMAGAHDEKGVAAVWSEFDPEKTFSTDADNLEIAEKIRKRQLEAIKAVALAGTP